MKKSMIAVMLSIMMAVLSVGGGYAPALAAETTSEEAVRIEQDEAADPEAADENEDANTGESAEDGSAEEAILAVEGEPVQEGEPAQETEPAQEIGEESDSESDEAVEENESEQDDASETANTSEIAADDEEEEISGAANTSVEADGSAETAVIEEEIITEDENTAMAADVWLWPFPTSNDVTSGFRPPDRPNHDGVDIGANIGDPIYAVNDGTIYKKYEGCGQYGAYASGGTPCKDAGRCNPNHGYYSGYCNNGYGNGICLRTKDGYYVQFAHMQSVNSSLYEGQYVTKGTLLGYVGGSGMATGKHCHYAVATGGEFSGFVNPMSMSYTYSYNNNPNGYLDVAEGGLGSFRVRGWAYDPDEPSKSIDVHVYVGGPAGASGAECHIITADETRDDVNAAFGITGVHGFDDTITTSLSGSQAIYLYAIDTAGGNNPQFGEATVTITKDSTAPVIKNVRITELTKYGYTVTCDVSDNVAVSRVAFPTWTSANDQDDLLWKDGTISGGTVTFRVNISDHGNESGDYITHIYAYDAAGNLSTGGTSINVFK